MEEKNDAEKIEGQKTEQSQQSEEVVCKNDNKRKNIIIRFLIIAACIALVSGVMIFESTAGYNKIYNGIMINGINVGGKTCNEAKDILDNYYNGVLDLYVPVVCDGEKDVIYGKDINISFNSQQAVVEAYEKGREGNWINRVFNVLKARVIKEDILFDVSYERLKFDSRIDKLVSKIGKEVIQPEYVREGDKLFIKTGVTGIEVDEDYIKREVINKFNYMRTKEPVVCNSKNVHPKTVDMQQIRNEIKTEVQDAKYINNSGAFEMIPQVVGIDFDLQEAQKIAESINEEGVQFSIQLIITTPQSTTQEVLKDLFNDELSTFTTYFNVEEKERTENVKLSAQFINDIILMPGQEFSYNTVVGERSTERGFQTAKVYKDGQIVSGLGGGICQTSSTLYNAVLLANLEIIARKNHSLPVGYVDLGRDATVSYGTIDFKFKNNRKIPIKISSVTSGGSLTVKILGTSEQNEKDVAIRTETIQVLPFTERIIEDSTLALGTTKVTQAGKKGYKVKAYKVIKEAGIVVEEKLLSTDTYAPIVQIKRIGAEPTLEGL